ncbi:MAG: PQQ-binding-like beta-propeller repeat protein [Acidobacteriota bacterium]
MKKNRSAVGLVASFLSILSAVRAGAVPTVDPVEGLWLGTATTERETIEVGLEFRRDAQGTLRLLLTQPVANYFGLAAQSPVRRDGDTVVVDEMALSLRLQGDRLEGTYPGPNSKASFTRTSWLPAPAPIPGIPAGPEPVWQTRLNGQIFASPAVFDGKVYIGTTGGVFNAVDGRTGKILWAFAAGRPVLGTALVTAEAVFFTCDNGYLFRLRREDGKEVWRYDLGDSRVSRVIGHPQVFDWDWHGPKPVLAKHDTGAEVEDQPLVAGGRVFAGNRGGGLYALSLATGERLWKTFFWGSWLESTPVLADGVLYVGSSDLRRVSALAPENGRVLWRTDVYGWTFGTPLLVGDKIFAGAAGGDPYFIKHVASFSMLDRATGKLLRRFPLPEVPGAHQWGIAGSPALAGDLVVVSTIQGGLMAFPVG